MALKAVRPGMIIDQAIIDRAGRLLIARKMELTELHIETMENMGIAGVYICEEEEEEEKRDHLSKVEISKDIEEKYEQVKVEDPVKVKLSESVRKRVAEGVQYLYQDTESSDFTSATKSITEDLMKAITDNDAIVVDISALKISDEYTFKHSVDVATMAMIVGKKYGFSQQQIYEIGISGLLHDIGKAQISTEVLNKAGKLTEKEFALMKQHSLMGYRILMNKEELSDEIKLGVLQHHEKINGSGYPMGVSGDKICQFAKIIAVADIYDALVTERPYKKPYSPRGAVEMIMAMTHELDIYVMRCFFESIILYPVGTDVDLSNGERARVIENSSSHVLRPKVMGLESGRIYDLAMDRDCANIIIL